MTRHSLKNHISFNRSQKRTPIEMTTNPPGWHAIGWKAQRKREKKYHPPTERTYGYKNRLQAQAATVNYNYNASKHWFYCWYATLTGVYKMKTAKWKKTFVLLLWDKEMFWKKNFVCNHIKNEIIFVIENSDKALCKKNNQSYKH